MHDTQTAAARELNNQLLKTYWEIGRIIVEHEQDGNVKAKYGTHLLTELAKELTCLYMLALSFAARAHATPSQDTKPCLGRIAYSDDKTPA